MTVEALAAVQEIDLMVVDLMVVARLKLAAVKVEVMSLPLGEANLGEVSTSSAQVTGNLKEGAVFCCLGMELERNLLKPWPAKNERQIEVLEEYSHGKTCNLDVLAV